MSGSLRRSSLWIALAFWLMSALVQAAEVRNVRMWLAPDNTRLVFDLSGPVKHKIFTLSNPDRIVLDLKSSRLNTSLSKVNLGKSAIRGLRSAAKGKDLRIVLDMKRRVRPKSFDLKPNDQYGHRLVLDLFNGGSGSAAVKKAITPKAANGRRDIVIAIDAGHGGEDPGALGPGRVKEKVVVLAIAKELKRLLDAEPGYKGRLTRSGDYYISLRGRTKAARQSNADLFVSIHADAFKDKRAKGASVWVLSPRGATSEVGRWLARKENSTDLIGGVGSVSLEDKDDVLAGVLLDMSMTASRADSRVVAKHIHKNISRFAKMHKPFVEQAGFVVLKSPDIPSILVETGFISNPDEARKLKSRSYQRKMAKAIFAGIKAHFKTRPPQATVIANTGPSAGETKSRYKVVRGDSLGGIAARHGMSIAALRKLNNLKTDVIRIGQVLNVAETAAVKPVASPVVQLSHYKVVSGDSLGGIAARHGISVASLRKLNGLRSDVIRVGQTLKVRPGPVQLAKVSPAEVRKKPVRYKVSRGDTLGVIAARNGVSVKAIRKENRLRNDVIRVGQVLRIPAS
ncbi:N-acetylmuramoyl-L-alanine amidase [Marinobacterium jannaschii]|uniref:N-acetylmuramoyl-L-alanine amidase n=1 Tax=Marinobacterium jannaschii TaxID=64970 RepID=UPI000A05BA92|nr:N-acetylmuramoyl-L-alanine amidase [Marinobacterium jannaschii]